MTELAAVGLPGTLTSSTRGGGAGFTGLSPVPLAAGAGAGAAAAAVGVFVPARSTLGGLGAPAGVVVVGEELPGALGGLVASAMAGLTVLARLISGGAGAVVDRFASGLPGGAAAGFYSLKKKSLSSSLGPQKDMLGTFLVHVSSVSSTNDTGKIPDTEGSPTGFPDGINSALR